MSFQITSPFEVFTDKKGEPLENGFIYIGEVNLNPETNPVLTFWDEERQIPAAQPIRTLAGYASQNGSPGQIYTEELDVSITVRNKKSVLVFSDLDSNQAARLVLVDASTLSSIASMTVLAKANLTDGLNVDVSGYYTQGDGGGGAFYWNESSTTTENGGTVFEADEGGTGRWLRIFDGSVTVKWFGALGDGIQDDTSFIQGALDYAAVVVAAGSVVDQATNAVYVPAGTYLTTGVTIDEGVMLTGAGQQISMFTTVGAVTAITMGNSSRFYAGIWVIDIGILGDGVTAGSIGILHEKTIRNCGIQRVYVQDCDTLLKGITIFGFQLLDCHLLGALSYCLDGENYSHSTIANTRFDVAGIHCVRIDGQVTATVNLTMIECKFQSAKRSGFHGVDCNSINFIGCDWEANSQEYDAGGPTTVYPNCDLVSGTGGWTDNVYTFKGGFMAPWSGGGNVMEGIRIEVALTVSLLGFWMRGGGFNKGIETLAGVLNLTCFGSYFESIFGGRQNEIITAVGTRLITDNDTGQLITNNTAFDFESGYNRQDVILLRNEAGVAGQDEYGGSIAGTSPGGGTNRRVVMAPKQTGVSTNNVGWSWGVHFSASDVAMVEAMVLDHLGTLTVKFGDFVVTSGETFLNLPVSAGTSGSLWNDSGIVKVVP
jgi:hypothetical protein